MFGPGRGLESSKCNWGAAAGSGGKWGLQLKQMPQSGPGAAAEADTSGEQQLKRTQSGSTLHRELSGAGLHMVGDEGEVAEQAKQAQLLAAIMLSITVIG